MTTTYRPRYARVPRTGCRHHVEPDQVSYQIVRAGPRLVDLVRAWRAQRRMVAGERVSFDTWLDHFHLACKAYNQNA
jgi:hypothetical protein